MVCLLFPSYDRCGYLGKGAEEVLDVDAVKLIGFF
jgi:hypothetical protein